MTVQKQVVPVALSGGLDTKTDPKQVVPGKMLVAENVYRKRGGEYQKRYGIQSLGTQITANSDIEDGIKLATFNDELNIIGNRYIYTYAPSSSKWVEKSSIDTAQVTTSTVINNSYEQTSPDSATNNGITVYAWEDSSGGVRYAVIDEVSGAAIVANGSIDSSASRPRVIPCGRYIFIFYYEGGHIYEKRLDTLNPYQLPLPVSLTSTVKTGTPYFDVCVFGSKMLFAYRNTSDDLAFGYYLTSRQVGTTLLGYPDATSNTSEDPNGCLTIFEGLNNTFHIAWHNTSAGIKHIAYNADFTTYKTAIVVSNYTATAVRNITGIISGNTVTLVYEKLAASALNYLVTKSTITVSTNTASGAFDFIRGIGLASKIFEADGRFYVLGSYSSDLQATYFLFNMDGVAIAKILPGLGGGHTVKQSQIPGVHAISTDKIFIPVLKKTRLVTENGTNEYFTLRGISKTTIDFDSTSIGQSVQLGQNLHINAGFLLSYDGLSATEHGFHLYPEQPTTAEDGSGNVSGAVSYVVVWEWIDNKGQIHRSAPSIPYAPSAPSSKKIQVTVPALRVTSKTGVIAALYRTKASGTVYYRVNSITSPTYNDASVDTVTITDNASDATIATHEILYTLGGVVENISPPAAKFGASFKNRVILGGLEDENSVWYSKQYVLGEGIAFSDVFQMQIDATGGPITALIEMDDKLVIFKKNAIFFIVGDGPTDNNQQNNFSQPQLISADVGCTEPNSVVRTKDGLMFKSSKGIYLLDRGLQTTYIGADVESFNYLTITNAVTVDKENQVRFTSEEGITLVYSHYFREWVTATNQVCVSSINWQGDFVFLKESGESFKEVDGLYSDSSVPIVSKLGTSWLQFAGIQGYQRVFAFNILGEYVGTHRLKVTLFYDFQESSYETFYINAGSVIAPDTYGSDETWGSGTYWGGSSDGVYQFQVKPRRQKCQSVRILIEDTFPENTGTGSFKLSAITCEIGVLKGMNRMPATRMMTR